MKLNKKYKIVLMPLVFVILAGLAVIIYLKGLSKYNILLITLDACRADHLGCYGYKRNTSPNINRLAREGIIFTQAISQSSHTAPSVVSLLTSTFPNIHQVKDWGYQLNPNIHLYKLSEVLKRHGYMTALITDQIALSLIKGLERDFTTYNTVWTYTFGPNSKKVINITDWAIEWIKNNKNKKFFLWLYYLDPHGPYKPPYPYNKIFLNDEHYIIKQNIPISDNDSQFVVGKIPRYLAINDITEVDYYISQYDGEIRYVDSQIGRLYEALKKLNLDKKTIIIITSDHGEAMGEHNLYFCHTTFLYDELIKIPLIIKFNKTASFGRRIDVQVRSIDIMPTILDILGIKNKKYKSMQGMSLLPLISNLKLDFPTFAYSEFLNRKSVRTKEWKLVYDNDAGQQRFNNNHYELYNLKDDPQELNNLVSIKKDRFEFLKKKLDNYIKQESANQQSKIIKPILDEEVKERLKSLGYAQ